MPGRPVTNEVVAHAATVNVAGAKSSALHTPDRIRPSSIAVIWLIYRSAYSFFVWTSCIIRPLTSP